MKYVTCAIMFTYFTVWLKQVTAPLFPLPRCWVYHLLWFGDPLLHLALLWQGICPSEGRGGSRDLVPSRCGGLQDLLRPEIELGDIRKRERNRSYLLSFLWSQVRLRTLKEGTRATTETEILPAVNRMLGRPGAGAGLQCQHSMVSRERIMSGRSAVVTQWDPVKKKQTKKTQKKPKMFRL